MYVIHGTSMENIEAILTDKELNKTGKSPFDIDTDFIFTQLLYKNLPHEDIHVPHWFDTCFVFDKEILKDLPFIATNIGGFDNPNRQIILSKNGGYKHVPNMKPLKDYINEKMENNKDFLHSHELLFNTNISLKKYCIGIYIYQKSLTSNPITPKMMKLSKKLEIPIKVHHNRRGINEFIEMIKR
jgi:hypothetical protein